MPIQRCPTGAIVWIDESRGPIRGLEAKKITRKSPLPVDLAELPPFKTVSKAGQRRLREFSDHGCKTDIPVSRRTAGDGRQHGRHHVRARVDRRRRCVSHHARPRRWASTGLKKRPRVTSISPAGLLIFIEPEGEHAAAAVTAGLSMTGLRATNFSSGQGIAYMHESLYAAVGKRLTYVLNMGCRAMTKSTLNVHAGHDDYHCIDDTGFFQVFGKSAQEVCDLNMISAPHCGARADARHLRAGRVPHHPPDRVADAAGARTDRRISRPSRRHHRHADAGAAHACSDHAAAAFRNCGRWTIR